MRRMSPWAYAHLVKAMEPGELTCAELAEVTGLCKLTVYHYAKALHQAGMVHITEWRQDSRGRDSIIVYKLGRGKDATRKRITSSQSSKAWRTKRAQIEMQRALCTTTQQDQA